MKKRVQIDFIYFQRCVFVFCMRGALLLEKRGRAKRVCVPRIGSASAKPQSLNCIPTPFFVTWRLRERERGYATRVALAHPRSLIPWLHPSCILLGKYNALIMCTYPRGRCGMYLKHTRKSIREIFFCFFCCAPI